MSGHHCPVTLYLIVMFSVILRADMEEREKRAKYGDCSRLVSDSAGLSPLTCLTVPGAGEESEVREDGRHVGQERPAGHHNEDGRADQK